MAVQPRYRADAGERFSQALAALTATTRDGRIVVEHPNPRLAGLLPCRRGEPSELATARYQEILRHVGTT